LKSGILNGGVHGLNPARAADSQVLRVTDNDGGGTIGQIEIIQGEPGLGLLSILS
jgi:hypothetical protein